MGWSAHEFLVNGSRHAWQEAASFAARAHRNQFRRDGRTPYIAHAVRVAMVVTEVFDCHEPEIVCAALLHDTIEDTPTDYDDVAERFGLVVADLVAALTKNMTLPEGVREEDYDARLARAGWGARLVKLADTYDNLCDVANYPPERLASKREQSLERCRRAITLARPDASDNPIVRAAVERVEALMAQVLEGAARADS